VKKNSYKTRKGISTLVGSIFFLVLMFAVFGAILTAFQLQTDLIGVQQQVSDIEVKKSQEKFSINPYYSGNLHVDVTNDGTNAIEVVDVWQVETGDDLEAKKYPVVSIDAFVPPGSTIDVMKNYLPAVAAAGGTYNVKVVTSLGNIVSKQFTYPTPPEPDDEEVIVERLLAKPSVLASFPNPLSQNGNKAIITLVVGNPTPLSMIVHRVSLQVVNPNNPNIFDSTASCSAIEPITPLSGTWKCKGEVIYWEDTMSSLSIPARSASVFSAKIHIASGAQDSPINSVATTTYSSLGQFGNTKSDTLSTISDTDNALPYIYQSSNSGGTDRLYIIPNVPDGTTQPYFFTIENLSATGSGSINEAGSFLLINIPKGFGAPTGFASTPAGSLTWVSTTQMSDGSYHIKVDISATDISPQGKRTFQFNTQAPIVSNTKLYTFYAYASGFADGATNDIIGPVSETLVQVIP